LFRMCIPLSSFSYIFDVFEEVDDATDLINHYHDVIADQDAFHKESIEKRAFAKMEGESND